MKPNIQTAKAIQDSIVDDDDETGEIEIELTTSCSAKLVTE